MTTTPKSVILAVVIVLGLVVLTVAGGEVALVATHNGHLPPIIVGMATGALGGLIGLLGSTRTTPELPPGTTLTGGTTTLTTTPVQEVPSPVSVDSVIDGPGQSAPK